MFCYRHWQWKESVPSSVQHRDYDQPEGNLQYQLTSGPGPLTNHLTVGVDINGQRISDFRHPNLGGAEEGPELVSDQSIRQRSTGLFALDRLELGPEWGLFLAVRQDRIRNELDDHLRRGGLDLSGSAGFDKTTGRIGFTWNPRPEVGFYADWAQGFLPPATEELYANPDALGGFNTGLQPSTSEGEELGVRGSLGSALAYDLALFHLKTRDDFERYRVTERPLETFYRNGGDSRRNGAELSLTWMPVSPLALRAAYTWNDFQYTEYESATYPGDLAGNRLPNCPVNQGYLDAEYRLAEHLKLGAGAEMRSRSYIDPTNTTWVDGYALLHARVSCPWEVRGHEVEFTAYGKNLTDEEYIAFTEPDPDGNSYQPAPGREFFFGARVWF